MSIYLDYNATTPIDELVVCAMDDAYRSVVGNPASQHRFGQAAHRQLEDEKRKILTLLGASATGMASDRLIVTSGGTESNNLAIIGIANHWRLSKFGLAGRAASEVLETRYPRVVVSSIEHPCVLGAAEFLESNGFDVAYANCREDGVVDLDHLRLLINDQTILVSVMWANHETGVIQPIDEVIQLCRAVGARFHTDASQAIGKVPVDFSAAGVDAMTVSPHKFYGPGGVGGLVIKDGVELAPLFFGGFQQWGMRPGTEFFAPVAGMRCALELATETLGDNRAIEELRDHFESSVMSRIDNVVVNGTGTRLPNTCNLSLMNRDRQAVLIAADLLGVYFSTGSACASGSSEPSPVLLAMGLGRDRVNSALRFSLGRPTSAEQIDLAIDVLVRCSGA